MDDLPPMPPVTEFKDRSTGLIVFGILVILLGCLCALLVPLSVVGQVMSAKMTGGAPNYRMAIPGVLMYGVLAVALIWLGIGSIRCRRWARALLLVFSWSWLGVGVIAVGFLLLFAPKMMEGVPPGAARIVAIIVAGVMWSVMFVIVPGVLVVFYQGGNVKATCEARDPVIRWTDACPLPVLGVSVWFAFGGLMLLAMPLVYNGVLPCFGILLSGLPGTLVYLVIALLWVYLAWAWYRLKPMAWWITVGVLLLFTISNVVTFTRVDFMDMYRLMGYPPEQIAMIERYNFLTSKTMVWWSAGFMLPLIGYLIWVKRFFRTPTHTV
jgi:hypothetical protein